MAVFGSDVAMRAAMRAQKGEMGKMAQKPASSGVIVAKKAKGAAVDKGKGAPLKRATQEASKAGAGGKDLAPEKAKTEPKFKVVVCGSSGCGKTSFLNQLAPDPEPVTELTRDWCRRTTLHLELAALEGCPQNKGDTIAIRFFEISGGLTCPYARAALTSDAHAAVIMYDTTQVKSYEEAQHSIEAFLEYINADMPYVLVGNKSDKLSNGDAVRVAAAHRQKAAKFVPEFLVSIKTCLEDAHLIARIIVRKMLGDKEVYRYFLNKQQLAEDGRYNVDGDYLYAKCDDDPRGPLPHFFALDAQKLLGEDWCAFYKALKAAIKVFAPNTALKSSKRIVTTRSPSGGRRRPASRAGKSPRSKGAFSPLQESRSQDAELVDKGLAREIVSTDKSAPSPVQSKSSSPPHKSLSRKSSSGSEGATSKSDHSVRSRHDRSSPPDGLLHRKSSSGDEDASSKGSRSPSQSPPKGSTGGRSSSQSLSPRKASPAGEARRSSPTLPPEKRPPVPAKPVGGAAPGQQELVAPLGE